MAGADEAEDEEVLRCLKRALAAADHLLGRSQHEPLSEAERQLVLALMTDLSLTSSALARRSRELERRIAGVNAGMRAASSYHRTLALTPAANRRQ